ncbi:MAG: RimK family alpha-L-glutamate ligase [Planctomycetales bacterium]|nr:RimK family alpha-L-glutamate ligase [Planctomycetales bacterium]
MKVVILSQRDSLHSTRRLVEATRAAGASPRVIDPLECTLVVERRRPEIYLKGKRLRQVDVVLPRIGASVTEYGAAVVYTFEMMGIPVVNTAASILRSRDKFRALQMLAGQGVPIPRTVLARKPGDFRQLVDLLGGMPVILKLLQGTQGIGVMLATEVRSAESILETVWEMGRNLLIQKFIGESKGRDVRVFVVGGRVVGAMRRQAKEGEFRSNIHRGAEGVKIELDDAYKYTALRAARVLGLQVAGVDLLESADGPLVMEVNSSPGLQGIEKALDEDVAARIIEYALDYAAQTGPGGPVVRKPKRRKVAVRAVHVGGGLPAPAPSEDGPAPTVG